jgi:pimeloyl-ACP methyl ester carboxylesterase
MCTLKIGRADRPQISMRRCLIRDSLRALVIGALAAACQLLSQAPCEAADALHGTGQYAELPGVRLWYSDTGGSGTPVVLLHANSGTSENWSKQVGALSAAGYRVISFDRRGWGKSVPIPGTGPQPGTIADDLDALTNELHLPPFCLVGVAGGGFAALDYAAWRPEKLRALVVAASTGLVREQEIDEFFQRLLIPGFEKLPEAFTELSASFRGSNPTDTATWTEIEARARQHGAPSQPMRTKNDYAKLASIPTPTLVLAADADLLAPPPLMRLWSAHLRSVEWHVITEAGHAVAWEKPKEFNQILLDFLSRYR